MPLRADVPDRCIPRASKALRFGLRLAAVERDDGLEVMSLLSKL